MSEGLDTQSELLFDVIISRILSTGAFLSGILIFAGFLLAEITGITNGYSNFSPQGILEQIIQFSPIGIIFLGILVLLSTPIIRVTASILWFAWRHDMKFVVICAFVLMMMLSGFLVGLGD